MTSEHSTNIKGIIGKICPKCRLWYPLNKFYKNKREKDGLRCNCKYCLIIQHKNYRINNLDACRARSRVTNTSLSHKYRNYQWNAKRRDIDFILTKEQLEMITNQPCFYCDSNEKVGIDRVDSNIGYLVENCVPCCKWCNTMKLNRSLEDFLNHVTSIYEKSCNEGK